MAELTGPTPLIASPCPNATDWFKGKKQQLSRLTQRVRIEANSFPCGMLWWQAKRVIGLRIPVIGAVTTFRPEHE